MKSQFINSIIKILSAAAFFSLVIYLAAVFIFLPDISLSNISEPNQSGEIRALFFGDLMLDRHVGEKIEINGIDWIFEKLAEAKFFSNYDLVSANLEGAVTDGGDHYPPDNVYDFAFDPEKISALKKYNFTFFNLANNHFSDQGDRGIIETRANLERLGFDYSGCFDGKVSADCSATIIELNGKKIGIAGFSSVYSLIDIEAAQKIISDLKKETDWVIVNLHSGVEYEHNTDSVQIKIAHSLIDAGADAIIGHHPHVVQGMEAYNGKPIFYSLGNFVFDQYFSPDTQEELAVSLILKDNGEIEYELFPLISSGSQVDLMSGEEKDAFLKKFKNW